MKNNIIDRIIVDDCNVIGFSSNMFTLNGARPVYIGKDSLVKVCVSVGLSKEGDIKSEFKKSEKYRLATGKRFLAVVNKCTAESDR